MISEIYNDYIAELELYEAENPDQVCEKCEEIKKEIEKVLTNNNK